jgi:hypothetical protein
MDVYLGQSAEADNPRLNDPIPCGIVRRMRPSEQSPSAFHLPRGDGHWATICDDFDVGNVEVNFESFLNLTSQG